MIDTKTCNKCGETKNLSDFPKCSRNSSGYLSTCKICTNLKNKQYRDDNLEAVKTARKKHYDKNIEKMRKQKRDYGAKNKAKKRQYDAEYRKNNAEKIAAYKKEWDSQYRKQLRVRILRNLRRRVHHALKGIQKSESTLQLIGCSLEQFTAHIEAQFTEGMSWENYGEWHIDHIKPCYSFNLLDADQQKECFHWSNQRPLWAKDNMSRPRPDLYTRNQQ